MIRYYSCERPISIGTYPKIEENPVLNIVNFDERQYVSAIKNKAYGYIEYENPLDDEVLKSYELINSVLHEDKAKICKLFGKLLQYTRFGSDIEDIKYSINENGEETATIYYRNDYKKDINVTADSGIAMIRDITKENTEILEKSLYDKVIDCEQYLKDNGLGVYEFLFLSDAYEYVFNNTNFSEKEAERIAFNAYDRFMKLQEDDIQMALNEEIGNLLYTEQKKEKAKEIDDELEF